jgi:hypothetical protein
MDIDPNFLPDFRNEYFKNHIPCLYLVYLMIFLRIYEAIYHFGTTFECQKNLL